MGVFVPSALGAGGGRRANCEGGGVPESSSHLLSQRGHERIQARPGGAAIDWRVQTTGPRRFWPARAKIFECTACPKVGATVIARCWGVSAAGSWRVSTLVNEQCVERPLASRGLRRGLFAGLKMMPRLRLTAERVRKMRFGLVKGVLNEAGGDAKQPGGCQSQINLLRSSRLAAPRYRIDSLVHFFRWTRTAGQTNTQDAFAPQNLAQKAAKLRQGLP